MKVIRIALPLMVVLLMAGCASTTVTNRESKLGNEKLPRPDRIIVYDFAASPADIPAESSISDQYAQHSPPQTPEQIETGRKLGGQIAQDLVEEIQEMGLPAVRAAGQPTPQPGDILIKGYLVSVEEGSEGKRILIGFGSGNAELKTVVEGYEMTVQGPRQLGSGELDAAGSKSPGMLVPLAVAAATSSPIGLIVGGAVKLRGEVLGSDTIEGSAQRTAEEIAKHLKAAFQKQGWI